MNKWHLWIAPALLVLGMGMVARAEAPKTGTLEVVVQEFTSEITLKKKVEKTLKSGGIEWGAKDGHIVFTMVNKRFVNFDIPHFTRYGSTQTIELPEGEYSLTGIGIKPVTAFSPEKFLEKGAYFNEGIMRVRVVGGEKTTLTVRPVIRKNSTLLLKFFIPELLTTSTIGGETSEEISIVARHESSVDWPDYQGSLKFEVKK